MELYEEILQHAISSFQFDAEKVIEMQCYQALEQIKAIHGSDPRLVFDRTLPRTCSSPISGIPYQKENHHRKMVVFFLVDDILCDASHRDGLAFLRKSHGGCDMPPACR